MRSHSGAVPSELDDLPPHAKSPNCMPASTSHNADAKKTGSFARFCDGNKKKNIKQTEKARFLLSGFDENTGRHV